MPQPLFYEVVLYNVPLSLENEEFTALLKSSYPDTISARRIMKFPHRIPTTLIRVRLLTQETRRRILARGCELGTVWYRARLPKRRYNLRRCYNCQQFTNHLARNCTNAMSCMKCSGQHATDVCESKLEKCTNCGRPHCANSTLCPRWLNPAQLRLRPGI